VARNAYLTLEKKGWFSGHQKCTSSQRTIFLAPRNAVQDVICTSCPRPRDWAPPGMNDVPPEMHPGAKTRTPCLKKLKLSFTFHCWQHFLWQEICFL